jgi:hypothetical protein
MKDLRGRKGLISKSQIPLWAAIVTGVASVLTALIQKLL